jgi:uncharacterized protein
MRGESLPRADVRWNGLSGDRQFAFYRSDDMSPFPWLTGRVFPGMVLWRAQYEDDGALRTSNVRVNTEDDTYDVTSPTLLARMAAESKGTVALIRMGRGTFDSMPISVVGQGTLDALGQSYGAPVAAARFRPNIVIDRGCERDWIGGRLLFGDTAEALTMRADRPIERCSMITIDHLTAERAPPLMRTVAQAFNNEIGIYCSTEIPGAVAVGMRAWLAK